MNILTEDERAALLRALSDAPDEVLIDAVRQRKDWMKNIRSSFDEVRGFVGMKIKEVSPPPAPPTPLSVSPAEKQVAAPDKRPNVNPGRSSITKIGKETAATIKEDLKVKSRDPFTYLNGKYEEHLKLLHNRGEIKYDGREFYL